MKTSQIFLGLLLLFSIVSCKKKTENTGVDNPAPCVLSEYGWSGSPDGIGNVKFTLNSQHYPIRADLVGSTYSTGTFNTYHYLNDSLIDTITSHYISMDGSSRVNNSKYVYDYLPNGRINSIKFIDFDTSGT